MGNQLKRGQYVGSMDRELVSEEDVPMAVEGKLKLREQ
jgi:hypothetical protein